MIALPKKPGAQKAQKQDQHQHKLKREKGLWGSTSSFCVFLLQMRVPSGSKVMSMLKIRVPLLSPEPKLRGCCEQAVANATKTVEH